MRERETVHPLMLSEICYDEKRKRDMIAQSRATPECRDKPGQQYYSIFMKKNLVGVWMNRLDMILKYRLLA